jgi:heme-degrading monooxygenase HmoA
VEDEMAVGLRLKFAGGTQAQYEAVHGHMNVQNDPPDGLIFHSAGPIDEGWGVIDFWESRDHFDRFIQSRLMPAVQELGERAMQAPPDIKQFEVFNILKP